MKKTLKMVLTLALLATDIIAASEDDTVVVCNLENGMDNYGTVKVLKSNYAINIKEGQNIDNYGILDFIDETNVQGGTGSSIINRRFFDELGLGTSETTAYLPGKEKLYAPINGIGIIYVGNEENKIIYNSPTINGVSVDYKSEDLYNFIFTTNNHLNNTHNSTNGTEAVVLINQLAPYEIELKQPSEEMGQSILYSGIANKPPANSPYQASSEITVIGNFDFVCDNSKYTEGKFTFDSSKSDIQISKAVPQTDIDVTKESTLTFSLSSESDSKIINFEKTLTSDETSNITIDKNVTFEALSGSVLNFGI